MRAAAAPRPPPPGRGVRGPRGSFRRARRRTGELVRVRNWHRPAMRFEDFIERTCTGLRAAGITRRRDPHVPLYLSKVMLEFGETLAPGRRRERLPMKVLARIAGLLPG